MNLDAERTRLLGLANEEQELEAVAAWIGDAHALIQAQAADLERLRADALRWQHLEMLWGLGEVEMTTDENGCFLCVSEPAEHRTTSYSGNEPAETIDTAIAAIAAERKGAG